MTKEQQNQKDYEAYVDRVAKSQPNKKREQIESELLVKEVKTYYHSRPLQPENAKAPAPVLREPV